MIIIRCDSSFEIGGGHVKRCLTIAKELRERGRICEFISINYDGNIISEILSNGFKVKETSLLNFPRSCEVLK